MVRSLRPIEVFPITTRHLKVLRVTDVTPGMRRVTLGGEQLAEHVAQNGRQVAAFRSDGFDDEFKLILKHPDISEAVGPTQADGVLDWPRGDKHLLFRTYTVRRWDPVAGELDIDFVKHGVGPATSWAYRVQPGETVQIAGPKSSSPHPDGVDWTLIAGDETALPAIGRWLEEWPEDARAQIFIEVGEVEHQQNLPVPEGVELTWLPRRGAEPGTTTMLLDAIRSTQWWSGRVFAWVAGEALSLTPIRRFLRNEKGLEKEQVEVTGYWRRQQVVVSQEDSSLPDLAATENEAEKLHELAEIVPGFALRVAATLDLAGELSGEPRSVAQVALATGTEPSGLARLLRYLEALNVTQRNEAGAYSLTSLGRGLESEHVAEALDLASDHAQRELLGMLRLLDAIRPPDQGRDWWATLQQRGRGVVDPRVQAGRVRDEAATAEYVAGALAQVPKFSGLTDIVIQGQAASTFAGALISAHPGLSVQVVGAAADIEIFTRINPPHDHLAYRVQPPEEADTAVSVSTSGTVKDAKAGASDRDYGAEVVLLLGLLNQYEDEAAIRLLRQRARWLRPAGTILVFGDVLDEKLAHEHDYEDDLIDFALHRGGSRTHAEYLALFDNAGFTGVERRTVGWGYALYEIRLRD